MAPSRVFGIQAWVALPRAQEEIAPSFAHHGANALPMIESKGVRVRLMVGALMGARSPVATHSDMVYAEATLAAGARLAFAAEHEERAIYVIQGIIDLANRSFGASQLLVLRRGAEVTVAAPQGARILLLGGAAMDGTRQIWWNFVSSSTQRIEQAKADWKEGRFPPVPGETEFIPLPQ